MDNQYSFILTSTASELIQAALSGSKSVILQLLFSFLYFFTTSSDEHNLTKLSHSPKTNSKTTKIKSCHPTDPKLPHYIPPNHICSSDKDNLLRLIKKHPKSSYYKKSLEILELVTLQITFPCLLTNCPGTLPPLPSIDQLYHSLSQSSKHHHLKALLLLISDATPTIPQLHSPHPDNAQHNPTPSPSDSFSFERASSSFSSSPMPHSSPSITSQNTSSSLPPSPPTINTAQFAKTTSIDHTISDHTDESNHSLNEISDPFNPFDIPRHIPFFTPTSTLNTLLLNEPSPTNSTTSTEHTLSPSHPNHTSSSYAKSLEAHSSNSNISNNSFNNKSKYHSSPSHLTHNSNLISLQTLLADKNVISITSLAAKTFPDTPQNTPISNNLPSPIAPITPPSQQPLSHISILSDDTSSHSPQSSQPLQNSSHAQASPLSPSLPPGQPFRHTSTPHYKSPYSLEEINSFLSTSPLNLFSLEKQPKTHHPHIHTPLTITPQTYTIQTPPDSPSHIQYLSDLHKKNCDLITLTDDTHFTNPPKPMPIPPQTYMLDKSNIHNQDIHTSQIPGPSNTTIETNTANTASHQKPNQNFTNKSTKSSNPSPNTTDKDTSNNNKQHNNNSPPSDSTNTTKKTNNNPPKIPDYKIPSFFIPKIPQLNPKQFISHLAHLPVFFSNSGPTFKIHITNSGLFVITPFTQTGANFLKSPILFPHDNKSTFISLNPITNNIPLRKFIIKNIPNHLNTSHFSHMPHLFKCHPLAQPNTSNTNKKTWSLIIYSVNPPLTFSTLNQNFPIHQYFIEPNRCTNCQKFNHLKHQCPQTFPICVFCSESHQSNICFIAQSKGKNLNLKCANCKLKHAASSKTCSFYQDLLPIHHPNLIPSPPPPPPPLLTLAKITTKHFITAIQYFPTPPTQHKTHH